MELDNVPCYMRWQIFERQGDYEKARELYSQAVEADRHHQNAKYGLGQIYLVQGETDEAIKTFESLPSSTEIDFVSYRIMILFLYNAYKEET